MKEKYLGLLTAELCRCCVRVPMLAACLHADKKAEYEHMRSWFIHMVPKVFLPGQLTVETDPVAILDRFAVDFPAKARLGLGMAIGDFVESTSAWPVADVAKCDRELAHKGLPTLTEVRASCSKIVQRVVGRGYIKSDEEFYAVRNAVDQQGVNAEALWPLLDAYESRG